MPWISKYMLHKHIKQNNSNLTLDLLEKIVNTYPKRVSKPCDCESDCDCVLFGIYDDYIVEYEYYLDN